MDLKIPNEEGDLHLDFFRKVFRSNSIAKVCIFGFI